jgi:polyhydroxybutyrate depolymerase
MDKLPTNMNRAVIMSSLSFMIGFILLLQAATARERNEQISRADQSFIIEVNGIMRRYLLHLPFSYDKSKPSPLVFVFHGGGATPEIAAARLGFNQLSDKKGFVVVYPEGIRGWNDGREAYFQKNDDVGFIRNLIEHLKQKLNVDANRIYATGNSNGGIFSQRLGCELSDQFAAIAPGAGTMAEKLQPACKPQNPISVVQFHGTNDTLVPFNGGTAGRDGKVISVPETISHWIKHNYCSQKPTVTYEPDNDPNDGTRVRRETYENCKKGNNIKVVLYVIEGGGHAWAGTRGYVNPESGKVSRDISATEITWAFFERHPKSAK